MPPTADAPSAWPTAAASPSAPPSSPRAHHLLVFFVERLLLLLLLLLLPIDDWRGVPSSSSATGTGSGTANGDAVTMPIASKGDAGNGNGGGSGGEVALWAAFALPGSRIISQLRLTRDGIHALSLRRADWAGGSSSSSTGGTVGGGGATLLLPLVCEVATSAEGNLLLKVSSTLRLQNKCSSALDVMCELPGPASSSPLPRAAALTLRFHQQRDGIDDDRRHVNEAAVDALALWIDG